VFNKFLVDTDVLVDFLRGREKAVNYLKKHLERIVISAISVAELYAGVKGDEECKELDDFIELFPILPVTREIARMGGVYKRDFFKSHNLGIADAIIAATADAYKTELKTLNIKHFPMRV
jgi:predicted nucleic acid-binding protein